jgi:hypothetical protein
MNMLTASKSGTTEHVPAGFEDKLVWLTKFGNPGVSMLRNGWHAQIEMHVGAVGASFTIRSEFDHANPLAALDVLIHRMLESLSQISKGAV